MKKSLVFLLACVVVMGIAWPVFQQEQEGEEFTYLPFVETAPLSTATNTPAPTATPLPPTNTPTSVPATATSLPAATATVSPPPSATSIPTATPVSGLFQLNYSINRAGLPDISFHAQTVNVQVGGLSQLLVRVDGVNSPYTYDPATGLVSITTTGSQIEVYADVLAADSRFGEAEIAILKDNKVWAYSHGFDDNVFIRAAMAEFEKYGWTGTIFPIVELIDDNRNQDWIEDRVHIVQHLNNNWSLGPHGFDASCQDYQTEAVVNSFTRLEEIVAQSNRTDYRLTSFAAPCFVGEYHPVILDLRNSGSTDVLFNESGGRNMVGFENSGNIEQDGYTVYPFNFDEPIGRGLQIENPSATQAIAAYDWVSAYANANQPVWFNTLAHGDKEDVIAAALSHLYNNYGPGGSDEVWVAPSDEIYAYQIIRLQGGLSSGGIVPIGSFPSN